MRLSAGLALGMLLWSWSPQAILWLLISMCSTLFLQICTLCLNFLICNFFLDRKPLPYLKQLMKWVVISTTTMDMMQKTSAMLWTLEIVWDITKSSSIGKLKMKHICSKIYLSLCPPNPFLLIFIGIFSSLYWFPKKTLNIETTYMARLYQGRGVKKKGLTLYY